MNAISKDFPSLTSAQIVIRKVAQRFDVPVHAILGRARTRDIVRVRHFAIHLAHRATGQSTTQIALAFHRLDHSTICHAIEANQIRMERDARLAEAFGDLLKGLRGDLPCLDDAGAAINEALAPHDDRAEAIVDDALEAYRRRKELIGDARNNLQTLAVQDADGLLRKLALLTLPALLMFAAVPDARAQDVQIVPCTQHPLAIQSLRERKGELVTARGLSGKGVMYELATSADGSWTIIATAPNGLTCWMEAGEAWEAVKPTVNGPEKPL